MSKIYVIRHPLMSPVGDRSALADRAERIFCQQTFLKVSSNKYNRHGRKTMKTLIAIKK